MSNYTKTTDFEAKDSLPTGDSGKIIRGAEFETEFDAISTAIATKADTAGPTFTGTLTFETISDGTIGVTAFVDEDDMSSDSATLVPTQQSVKAYVDSQVTAQDLDFQADSGGALSIDLDSETMTFTGGTGIDTSGSGNAVTFAIDSTVATLTGSQTLTNKTLTSPVLNTGVSGTAVLDEDNMASNSATQLATQQSIKAYVDSQVGANNELSEILANGNTTGGTNIVFGDSASVSDDRLVFGAGSDLQIYHTGTHSYIDDAGTGNLTLRGNASVRVEKYEGEILADFAADGAVSLYHDNSVKIATTSTGVSVTGNVAVSGTVDGRDVATDGSKLDGIEASADVTDTANVTAAGALMDSELTSEASVKALNQGVATTDSPTFAGVTVNGTVEFDGLSGTGSVNVTDILDQDDMSSNSATALATQQSIKAYVDSQVATVDTLAEVLGNGNTTGGTDIAVGTGDDITFADNSKAIFGAGSDLQIYHDSTRSYISDQGTGGLRLLTNELSVMSPDESENLFFSVQDGSTYLYQNGSIKLQTTSTGIDVTGVITTDGMTTSADINFGDNDKAVFGAGSDLQIYHSGLHSFITDAGTGDLLIGASSNIALMNAAFSENKLLATTDGALKLYYDGSQKLATTSTGIDVSGGITTSGNLEITSTVPKVILTDSNNPSGQMEMRGANTEFVFDFDPANAENNSQMDFKTDGSRRLLVKSTGIDVTGTADADNVSITSTAPTLVLNRTDRATDNKRIRFAHDGEDFRIQLFNDAENAVTNAIGVNRTGMTLDSIAFYEDTGTTAKLTWDASAETLNFADNGKAIFGAGNDFEIYSDGTNGVLKNTNSNYILLDSDNLAIRSQAGSNRVIVNSSGIDVTGTVTADGLTFGSNHRIQGTGILFLGGSSATAFEVGAGSEKMRLTSTGLGIGTSSPSYKLDVFGSSVVSMVRTNDTTSPTLGLFVNSGSNGVGTISVDNGGHMTFDTGSTGAGQVERMRIDSSGNVGIGTTSPATKVEISGTGFQTLSVTSTNSSPVLKLNSAASSTAFLQWNNAGSSPLSFYDLTASAERMRIDSSGNVGIGTSSPSEKLHVAGALRIANNSADTYLGYGSNSDNYISTASGGATIFRELSTERMRIESDGNLRVYDVIDNITNTLTLNGRNTGQIHFQSGGTEKMRMDSGGNLLVGKTALNIGTAGTEVRSNGQLIVTADADNPADFNRKTSDGTIALFRKDGTSVGSIQTNSGRLDIQGNANTVRIQSGTSLMQVTNGTQITFETAGSERMRIDDAGNLLVGTTSTYSTSKMTLEYSSNTNFGITLRDSGTATTAGHFNFVKGGSVVGTIQSTSSATSYNTSSDQRLKDNIVDAPSASDDIDAIQVRSFDWKADGSHQKYGMVAQELQSVAPEAVSQGETEEDMMGVDYSKLVPMLVKEIQSLRARVAQLEGEN